MTKTLYQKIVSFRYTSPTAHRENRRVFVYVDDDKCISAYDLDDEEFRKFKKEFMENVLVHAEINTEADIDPDDNEIRIDELGHISARTLVGYCSYDGTTYVFDKDIDFTIQELRVIADYAETHK